MSTEAFAALRADAARDALRAVEAAASGDPSPLGALLGLPDTPPVAPLVAARLGEARLAPPAPADAARGCPRALGLFEHRCALYDAGPLHPPERPDAWAAAELAWTLSRARALWSDWDRGFTPDPAADAALAEGWVAWFTRDPWRTWPTWSRLLLPEARAAFAGVCEANHLPRDVRRRVMKELEETFLVTLAGQRGGIPGWLDVATRVLELAPDPLAALAGHLPEGAWAEVGACLAGRGAWATTIAGLWALPRPGDRAAAATRGLAGEARHLAALADAHVALRLLDRWSQGMDGDPRAAWRVAAQNRGRLQGRLRALLARVRGDTLLEAVLSVPALAGRTRAATRRFALSWAWQEVSRDFPMDGSNRATPPCAAPESGQPPLADGPALRTWLLLVVLRGRLAHLERWLSQGGTGDQDATWGRLLSDALPAALRGPEPAPYQGLRDALSLDLPEHLDALTPTLRDLAGLAGGRSLKPRFQATLRAAGWHAGVPLPERGFERMQDEARRALAGRPAHEEEPWSP